MDIGAILLNLWADSGFAAIASGFTSATGWQSFCWSALPSAAC